VAGREGQSVKEQCLMSPPYVVGDFKDESLLPPSPTNDQTDNDEKRANENRIYKHTNKKLIPTQSY